MHKGATMNNTSHVLLCKMIVESKLLQRLLLMGSSRDSNVYLFVRLEKANYACLGAVVMKRYDINVSPVFIEWELVEYEQLAEKQYFKEVVSIATAK